MSHFTVMVRVPADVDASDLEDEVTKLLAPFNEQCDVEEASLYCVFNDTEDESRKKYETESIEMVMLDGQLRYTHSDEVKQIQMKIAGELGIDVTSPFFIPSEARDKIDAAFRERVEHVTVPHTKRYATFDEYMRDYEGDERDEKTGRYGYYHNPNAKWDWWAIGGRWRGLLMVRAPDRFSEIDVGIERPPVEAGLGEVSWVFDRKYHEGPLPGSSAEVDYCRIRDLDWSRIDKEARERAAKFWAEVDDFLAGKEFTYGAGPRDAMLALGMLSCRDADELDGSEFWKSKWPRQNRPGVDRFDVVAKKPNREELDARVIAHHFPVSTFARLDASGWKERGEMGWFGYSTDTPESNEAHDKAFPEWLKSGDSGDWVVVVDCHI
jgi:hypothetical protein